MDITSISRYLKKLVFLSINLLKINNYYVFFSVPVNMMGITYAILAQGSAFLHGSQTRNGGAADVVLNNLFAYVAYQAVVENLEPSNNPMIHDLSLTPR